MKSIRTARLAGWLAALAVIASCDSPRPAAGPGEHRTRRIPPPAAGRNDAPQGIEFVRAPPAVDVAPLVQRALGVTNARHRRLLVYVGAVWCEPCQYFHRAAEAHALDATLPALTLLEFDADRDTARLQAAGYSTRLIPLFAVPGPDGRATGAQIEGSIHGAESVQEITPRLRSLLDGGA